MEPKYKRLIEAPLFPANIRQGMEMADCTSLPNDSIYYQANTLKLFMEPIPRVESLKGITEVGSCLPCKHLTRVEVTKEQNYKTPVLIARPTL
jgi:hypothetical protein